MALESRAPAGRASSAATCCAASARPLTPQIIVEGGLNDINFGRKADDIFSGLLRIYRVRGVAAGCTPLARASPTCAEASAPHGLKAARRTAPSRAPTWWP